MTEASIKIKDNSKYIDFNEADLSKYGFKIKNETYSVIEVSSKPINLEINSSTDWAVVSVAFIGVVISVVIGCFTYSIQKNQIKSNLAHMRQRWQDELRQTAIDFSRAGNMLFNSVYHDPNYIKSDKSREIYSDFLASATKLRIMLDIKHDSNLKILSLINDISDALNEFAHAAKNNNSGELNLKFDTIRTMGNNFDELMRKVLEEAWIRIRKDLLEEKNSKA